ncbi:MAG: DegT/DnrJ/EryC1/StrS family aminotransferase [Paludibacteraceae bacterium]|nr:DegT/DnrJ/EryC1/StrS family aminotransferase [Paludibacteraceae bacterium]
MRKIQMVDLQTQYQHIKADIDRGIQAVIDSAAFVKGPQVTDFQHHLEAYTGAKHVIPVGNGTDALQIALMGLGLQCGDEVITPTFTFIATAEVVALLGLTPVVVDVDWETMNMSIESLEKAITPKTKAIVPVHLFGQCANMEAIMRIAQEKHLYVVEDACQAIGAKYTFADFMEVRSPGRTAVLDTRTEAGGDACAPGQKQARTPAHPEASMVRPGDRTSFTKQAGTIGHIGCTSFFPSKNLGCYGDGGAIFTNDDELAARMRAIANHGMVVRYHHDMVGVNSRLDGIQAAILDAKLPHLDEYIAARQRAAAYYDEAFAGNPHLLLPGREPHSTHVFHQYTLRVQGIDRDQLKAQLQEAGIPAMVYYPVPLHLQKAYQDPRYQPGDFPVAERLAACVLSLPMHTELDEEQLEYITNTINNLKI